jgi:HEAT repeat protein
MTRAAPAVALALWALAGAAACGGGLDSPSPERRATAVRALGEEPGDRPAPALLVAQRDPSPLVRRAAAEAIARRRGAQAAPALGAMLADPDPLVAQAAAEGLARLGELDAARGALVEGYARASPEGRVAIAAALSALGISLRDAVEAEARWLWGRNVAALERGSVEARAGAAEELGASGRAEAVARLRELTAKTAEAPRVIAAALRGLGETGDPGVRPVLEAALGSQDPTLAAAAAAALGRLGDPAATPPLARLAAAGGGPLNRIALEALEALPTAPEVSQALCGVALRQPVAAIAGRAARGAWTRNADCPASALAGRAARGDGPALAAFIELHPEPAVLAPVAARLTAAIGDPRAASELRRRAAFALGQLGWDGAAGAIEARARALQGNLAGARRRWIPGCFAPPAPPLPADPVERLARLEGRGTELPVRRDGANCDSPEWIDASSAADREELGALLAALGRIRGSAAAALLVGSVADPAAPVRAGAVEGLGFIGGDGPAGELVAALADPDARVRDAALAVLPRYGPQALPALARAVEGVADERSAQALARALGQTGAPEAVAPLAALLRGPGAGTAAFALATIGVAGGAEPLLEHLARKDAPGRVETLDALAQLASRSSGPALEAELLSERPEVRAAAVRAIGRLRYEPASRRLEALRVDYDGRVRRAAIEALAKLPSGRR